VSEVAAHPRQANDSTKLALGALGVVFGDIGTSPLYALRECFAAGRGIGVTEANVLGLLSLIFWSLLLVISVQYVLIVLRANNRGEGGELALSTLVSTATRNWRLWTPLSALGLFGTALFFGDGIITPAVSVMSAMEGLSLAAPQLDRFIIPGALSVLALLFFSQRHGTGAMGRFFGPIMLVWFIILGLLGLNAIVQAPHVLLAVNPLYGVRFFIDNGAAGFLVLSCVFLAVTGGEALYADMGHFGREPIRNVWFCLVLPSLILNYFGQGALLLQSPEMATNPFYNLAPSWALVPLILLATSAAVIASQAVISGVFSVTRQAVNLGYLPRLRILHSSEQEIGQVYVPALNWTLLFGTVFLVLSFRSSSALAGAYGLAVSISMLITCVLVMMYLAVAPTKRQRVTLCVLSLILVMDLTFMIANLSRLGQGGWLTILIAIGAYTVMATWYEGRKNLNWNVAKEQTPTRDFLAAVAKDAPLRVPGTTVYLASEASGIPGALMHNLRFNHVLHERNVLLSFLRPEVPFVPAEERVETETIGPGLYRVIARYGFMEAPNVVAAMRAADAKGVEYRPEETTYVFGRENPILTASTSMPLWRKRLFAFMGRNSQLAAVHFGAPAHRTLEISRQIRL
jgi:KUP system potassium uptake protein